MMAGLYDNEAGCYVECDWLDEADWYADEQGTLYMIPQAGVVAEIEGPDGPVIDELNRLCREQGMPTAEQCEALGLIPIYNHQKRFHPVDGYYYG
jgi:hypothetical protein